LKKPLKIIGWSVGVLLVLVGLACVAIYVFVTSDYARGLLENRATAMTGRKTTIGKIDVNWGRTSHVRIHDLQVANVDWGKADHMLKAKLIDFDIRLWPLLHGDIVLPQLTLQEPELYLERNAEGESNWSFKHSPVAAAAVDAVEPKQRSEAPIIGHLQINGGRISFIDMKRRLNLEGTVQTAVGQAPATERAELALKGQLEGKPLSLRFVGGSIFMLRDEKTPYPLDLTVLFGETELTLKGTVQDPFKFTGSNAELILKGPDLSEIFPLLGIPAPPTPPYQLSGKLQKVDGVWKVDDLRGRIGNSDAAGSVAIEPRGKRSFLRANLTSSELNFDDLAPLIGLPPKGRGAATAAKGDLIPNVPLHMERLREMDMDVTWNALKVTSAPYLPVQALKTRIQVENGKLLAKPLTVAIGGGTLTGVMEVDARTDNPTAGAKLQFEDVDLASFFRGSRYFDTTRGKLQGRVNLVGTGRSAAQVLGTARGNVVIANTGGYLSGLLVNLAGLDIGSALILYITEDNKIPIRCAIARLEFYDGLMHFDKTILDTRKSVLHVNGDVDLRAQIVNIEITAEAKEFSLLNLHAPVFIKGKIRSPKISIGKLLPIPFIELGGAKDVNCPALIKQTVGQP
jgi:uncharacterized protein involved in outer membrane biogenesis